MLNNGPHNGGVERHDESNSENSSTVGDLEESPDPDRRVRSNDLLGGGSSNEPSALEEFERAMNGTPEERENMIRRLDQAAERNPAAWAKLEQWSRDAERLAKRLGI
jgi:hypothetical protein